MSKAHDNYEYNWFHNRNVYGQTLAEELAEMVKPPQSFRIHPLYKKMGMDKTRGRSPDLTKPELDFTLARMEINLEKDKDCP